MTFCLFECGKIDSTAMFSIGLIETPVWVRSLFSIAYVEGHLIIDLFWGRILTRAIGKEM